MGRKRSSDGVLTKKENIIEKQLVENIVALQKVHTALAEKFDNLSKNIEKLLGLFEMAARSFASNPANQVNEKDTEFLDKINKLLDQNKVIAKGLTLMEERMREKIYGMPSSEKGEESLSLPSGRSRPLPKF